MKLKLTLVSLLHILTTSSLKAQTPEDSVIPSGGQLMVLQPMQDALRVNYIFGFENTSDAPVTIEHTLMIPQKLIDFVPVQGISEKEISINSEGRMILRKSFPPGKTSLEIGYIIDAKGGKTTLNLIAESEVENLVFVTSNSSQLSLSGAPLELLPPPPGVENFNGFRYSNPIEVGSEINLEISGIPAGRGAYWLLGSVFITALAALALLLTLKTRNQKQEAAFA
ncbi:MAG: hypothetical protein KBD78_05005 [Oligoflexales bacterium]|nr:hypothetical protein [Oligoflexales bacterium]